MKGNGKTITWAVVLTILVIFLIKKSTSGRNIPVLSTLANDL